MPRELISGAQGTAQKPDGVWQLLASVNFLLTKQRGCPELAGGELLPGCNPHNNEEPRSPRQEIKVAQELCGHLVLLHQDYVLQRKGEEKQSSDPKP